MNKHTHTVVVTIGRNVGGKAMGAQVWAQFKAGIETALHQHDVMVLQSPQMGKMRAHDQVGWWDGQSEPAATFVGLIGSYQNMASLRRLLSRLAADYQQEAIGCIITLGTDHLVCP